MIWFVYITVQLYYTIIKHQVANPSVPSTAIACILLLLGLIGVIEEASLHFLLHSEEIALHTLNLTYRDGVVQWLAGDYEKERDGQGWNEEKVEMMVGTLVDEDI